MRYSSVKLFFLIMTICSLTVTAGCGSSSTQGSSDTELLSVVAISRHGIRSPTSTADSLNQYTSRSQGFPIWPPHLEPPDVPLPAGDLTDFGQQNAARLGSWYRDFYAAQGILPPRGSCPAPGTVFIYADNIERTLHTAQGYLEGMFLSEATPDCGIEVDHTKLPFDPYIVTAIIPGLIDRATDQEVFNAKIGGVNGTLLQSTYAAQLQMLQTVTGTGTTPILTLPTTQTTAGPVQFAPGTLFDVADTLTETFELEYAQGMPDTDCQSTPGAQCVGWGAIPPGGLYDMTKLHVMNMELYCGLPSFAQVTSTNLMWQVVGTMDQTLSGVKNPAMFAPKDNKFSLYVAHDENIMAIAAFLGGLTWKAEGFLKNDPGPAGALVFELHRVKWSGQLIVRGYYVIASLDQMRNGTTLTLDTPPQRIPLRIPACGNRYDCPYDQFKSYITSHVSQESIFPPPAT